MLNISLTILMDITLLLESVLVDSFAGTYFNKIRPNLLKGGIDTCQGDSGGPLMVKDDRNNNWMTLVGVVSHGAGCAEPNSLGIYSKVSENIDWLYASMPDLNTCCRHIDIAVPDGENAVFCDTEYDDQ